MRKTYVEIDLSKINDNINSIAKLSNKKIMAILKANAYGHGATEVAKFLLEKNENISMFGVATLEEALLLQQEVDLITNNKFISILVLGDTPIEDVNEVTNKNIHLTIHSLAYAKALVEKELVNDLLVQIKIDTGMNRLGLKYESELEEIITLLKDNNKIKIVGIYTHYATADCNLEEYQKQYDKFTNIVKRYSFKYIHGANSAAALYSDELCNLVRPGIAIYGYNYSYTTLKLLPAMSFYTTIVDVKKINKDEYVGYGFDYQAKKDTKIAILPIGYADGLIRKNLGRKLYINGNYYPIIGRICMDQTMIEIDDNVKIGDKVEIFGENISLDEMAKDLETISYEVLCLISSRVPRIYKKD